MPWDLATCQKSSRPGSWNRKSRDSTQSPQAKIFSALVCILASTEMPEADPTESPASLPSILLGATPTATITISAKTSPFDMATPRTRPFPMTALTRSFVRTPTPLDSSMSWTRKACLSSNSIGMICGRASIRVTFIPLFARATVASMPINPEPTTTALLAG